MVEIEIQADGRVVLTDGTWRGVVDPHKTKTLDAITIGRSLSVSQRQTILDKWATIPVPVPDPIDPPLTNSEIYDAVIRGQKVLKAFVLSINDGTLIPGANISNAALKAIVKANM